MIGGGEKKKGELRLETNGAGCQGIGCGACVLLEVNYP
jgi:hypothetical protein